MRRVLFILSLLFCGTAAIAQDPNFSQFFASPLTLNPAFTGKFDGKYRFAANYRNQWPTINQAFTTVTASVDWKLMQDYLSRKENSWGLGIAGMNDQSAAGAVRFSYGSLATAYHIQMDEDGRHQLSAGFQAGYANMMINTSLLRFEDQLTSLGFTGNTSELFNTGNLQGRYWDVNAGLLYSGSSNDKHQYYLGFSLYHVNRPQQSFLGNDFRLQPRFTLHGGGYVDIGWNSTLYVSALQTYQANAAQTMLGGAFQLKSNPDDERAASLYAGAWFRLKDAVIPYAAIEINNLRIGISYDVNTSSLRPASLIRGGLEISLIYIFRPEPERGIICPKF